MYCRTWMKFHKKGSCRKLVAQVGKLTQICKDGALSVQYCVSLIDHWGKDNKCWVNKCLSEICCRLHSTGGARELDCAQRSLFWEVRLVNYRKSARNSLTHQPIHSQILRIRFPNQMGFPHQAKNHGQIARNSLRYSSRLWGFVTFENKTIPEQSSSEEDPSYHWLQGDGKIHKISLPPVLGKVSEWALTFEKHWANQRETTKKCWPGRQSENHEFEKN